MVLRVIVKVKVNDARLTDINASRSASTFESLRGAKLPTARDVCHDHDGGYYYSY